MATVRNQWKVAFDPITGSHQSSAHSVYDEDEKLEPNWVDQFRFESSLVYTRYDKGRSSINTVWTDDEGREFTMFMRQLHDAMPYVVGGRLSGTFHFVKYGASTGIAFEL